MIILRGLVTDTEERKREVRGEMRVYLDVHVAVGRQTIRVEGQQRVGEEFTFAKGQIVTLEVMTRDGQFGMQWQLLREVGEEELEELLGSSLAF